MKVFAVRSRYMSLNFKKVTVITGHYGCGKTNLAVNLALFFAKQGEPVTVIDLDIVNPYYRTNDFKDLFDEYKIPYPDRNWLMEDYLNISKNLEKWAF